MNDDIARTAFVAITCLWLSMVLFVGLIRYIVRREVKRALTGLRNAKFALTIRDPKSGRFVK